MASLTSSIGLFYIHPDWNKKIQLSRKYMTIIKPVEKGKEQRSSLYKVVRRSITFTTSAKGPLATYVRGSINSYSKYVFSIPLFPYGMKLTSNATAGDTVLNVDTTAYSDMDITDNIALESGKDWLNGAAEYESVSSYTATTITLSNPIDNDWKAGNYVYPTLRCVFTKAIEFNSISPNMFEAELTFNESFRAS